MTKTEENTGGNLLGSIQKGLKAIKAECEKLKSEIEGLKQRRDILSHAPLCKADVLAMFQGLIDEAAESSSVDLRGYALNFMAKQRPGGGALVSPLTILRADKGGYTRREINESCFLALLAEPAKKWLQEMIDSWPWPAEALELTSAERLKEIALTDAKIETLEAELKGIRSAAEEAGVPLP